MHCVEVNFVTKGVESMKATTSPVQYELTSVNAQDNSHHSTRDDYCLADKGMRFAEYVREGFEHCEGISAQPWISSGPFVSAEGRKA